jgi:hypothetical protein
MDAYPFVSPNFADRDPSDPGRRAVELAQRGRMILDVAKVDLDASEAALGPFHPTTWHFRNALAEARKSWDRLRAEFGLKALERALDQLPLAVLRLGAGAGSAPLLLIPIEGKTYRAEPVAGTAIAPVQWRLTRLDPPLEHGPYYACLLRDGSTQCDCAEWTYRPDGPAPGVTGVTTAGPSCKHLAALAALGWLDGSRRWEWHDA